MHNLRDKTILIVDDQESIRFAVSDFLSASYRVRSASDGLEALDVLKSEPVDLVITDIRMPRMDGLQLIQAIAQEYPDTQYALMTAYNADDYLRYVRERQIWNIIPKTTLLDVRFVGIMAYKLLSGDIFGPEKYFPRATISATTVGELHRLAQPGIPPTEGLYSFAVRTAEDYDCLSETVGQLLMKHGAPSMVLQVVEELASNALVRAPRHLLGELGPRAGARELLRAVVSDHGESPYRVCCGVIAGQAVVAIVDPHGTLERSEILDRLERYTTLGEDGLPLGVHDHHGRGLYISREHLDHLVFNIAPGKCTEVIGILALDQDQRYRSVSIYQTPATPPAEVSPR